MCAAVCSVYCICAQVHMYNVHMSTMMCVGRWVTIVTETDSIEKFKKQIYIEIWFESRICFFFIRSKHISSIDTVNFEFFAGSWNMSKQTFGVVQWKNTTMRESINVFIQYWENEREPSNRSCFFLPHSSYTPFNKHSERSRTGLECAFDTRVKLNNTLLQKAQIFASNFSCGDKSSENYKEFIRIATTESCVRNAEK